MSTKKQKDANRENAEKSTGPKSTEGKETSSKNATKHGLTARYDVIRSESQEDFDQYRKEMIEEFNPIGLMQHSLADRIISLSWRLKRAEQIHNKTIDAMLIINDDSWTAVLKVVRGGHRETFPHLDLGRMAIIDFSNERVLDKLLMYERRIENSLYKTIKELKKIQAEKMKNEANFKTHRRPPEIGPFYLPNRQNNPDTPEHIQKNMQNEPNSATSCRMGNSLPMRSSNMQNKPNSHEQTNVTPAISNDYESELLCGTTSLLHQDPRGEYSHR